MPQFIKVLYAQAVVESTDYGENVYGENG